jgi:hypothetical protein
MRAMPSRRRTLLRTAGTILGLLSFGVFSWRRRRTRPFQLPSDEAMALIRAIADSIATNRERIGRNIVALAEELQFRSSQIAPIQPLQVLGWDVIRARAPRSVLRDERIQTLRSASYLCRTINNHISDRAAYVKAYTTQAESHDREGYLQLRVYDWIVYQELVRLNQLFETFELMGAQQNSQGDRPAGSS